MDEEFDVVVIGAGPAGETAAGQLAEAGMTVAIAEAELVGGECAFYACMPSKALLRPEHLRRETERVPGLSPAASEPILPERVLARRDEVIRDLDDASQLPWLEERGIALFRGQARLAGHRAVEISPPAASRREPSSLRARLAVIVATGSAAAIPPIEGLDAAGAWNNRQATVAAEVPESMIVLGGGPVGCELAQAWASLGSAVVLIEGDACLLPREERFAGAEVEEGLGAYGVEVITGARLEAVRRREDAVEGRLASGRLVTASEILVATGRRPRLKGLGLSSVGVSDEGFLNVDGRLRVTDAMPARTSPADEASAAGDDGDSEVARPWLYAVGDVNGRALLTHTGKYQGRIAAADILRQAGRGDQAGGIGPAGGGMADAGQGPVAKADVSPLLPPRVTFTDPQVAAVGLTESAARGLGLEIVVSETRTSGTPGASFYGKDTPGTSRLIADSRRGVLVGATFVGFETAELLHAATIAIVGEVPVERLRHAIPAFPTRSEIWLDLLAQLP